MKKILIIISFLLSLTGCNSIDTVEGQAFLKTKGGDIKTCAGNEVLLEKYNDVGILKLSDEYELKKLELKNYELWIKLEKNIPGKEAELYSYKSKMKEYNLNPKSIKIFEEKLISLKANIKIAKKRIPESRDTFKILKRKIKLANNISLKTLCDKDGNFKFLNIEEGKYYITTKVEWKVGNNIQGGIVNRIVTLDKKNKTILLTQ